MGTALRYKSADCVALEFETTISTERTLVNMAQSQFGGLLKVDHDASSESPVIQLTPLLTVFNPTDVELTGTRLMAGMELITAPLYGHEVDDFIIKLTGALESIGELPMSQRSAIHIHCGFPTSLILMKKVLLFATRFESLFFQLAGNGYRFRGLSNEATYCKPLTSPWGPPAVRTDDDRIHQLFRVEDLLTAKTSEEFWRTFGVNPDDPKRYHPARYFWLNILSTLIHGTLEFRIWNVTLNPRYLKAEMELCRKVADMIIVTPYKILERLPIASVYEPQDNAKLLKSLITLISTFGEGLSPETVGTLFDLLEHTTPVIMPPGYVQTHLWNKFVAQSSGCRKERLDSDDVRGSGYIDSHNSESAKVDLTDLLLRSENV